MAKSYESEGLGKLLASAEGALKSVREYLEKPAEPRENVGGNHRSSQADDEGAAQGVASAEHEDPSAAGESPEGDSGVTQDDQTSCGERLGKSPAEVLTAVLEFTKKHPGPSLAAGVLVGVMIGRIFRK